jgi:serine/threonine protein kinase
VAEPAGTDGIPVAGSPVPAASPVTRDLTGKTSLLEDSSQRPAAPLNEASPPPLGPDPDEPFPQDFGRYELTRQLGRGGMGTVYLAHDRELDLEVALKIPHPEALARPLARERFRREARGAARLAHPNLAWALDVGRYNGIDYPCSSWLRPDSFRWAATKCRA